MAVCLSAAALLLAGCESTEAQEKKTVVKPAQTQETESGAALAEAWYGWWRMDEAEGDWAQMDGFCWDCCAEAAEENDALCLRIWDEDLPKSLPLARLGLRESEGAFVCTGGEFLSGIVEEGGCEIQFTQEGAELSLTIEGRYEAPGEGGFAYCIYLKPWGQRWSEGEELPYFYWDWYLPRIESGQAMPEEIG